MTTHFGKISNDVKYEFTDSKNTANYINENIEDNSLIIILDIDRHVSAIPYIDSDKNLIFYNIQNEEYQTFSTWDTKGFTEKKYYIIEKQIYDLSNNYENIYIMYGLGESNKYVEYTVAQLIKSNIISDYIYKTENELSIEKFGIHRYNNI